MASTTANIHVQSHRSSITESKSASSVVCAGSRLMSERSSDWLKGRSGLLLRCVDGQCEAP